MPIPWRDSLSMGEPSLDHQHRGLLSFINTLEKALETGNFLVVQKIFGNVAAYMAKHFREEEEVFESVRYPQRDWHRQLHAEILKRASALDQKYVGARGEAERKEGARALLDFFNGYVLDHMIKEDFKARSHIKADPTAPVSVVVHFDKTEAEQARLRAERGRDVEYALPPHLAHLLKRIAYVAPELPPIQGVFDDFDTLCEAAILRRIDKVLIFFQRHNPDIRRELPPFFLSSPQFRARFLEAVRALVFPRIRGSRQVRMLSTNIDIRAIDEEKFWDKIANLLRVSILDIWGNAWDEMRPIASKRADGTPVMKIKDDLKVLRGILQPEDPADYDLPKIGRVELDVFKSILDTQNDWWEELNRAFQVFFDLYEQEKDPRIFQQKARPGALRDYMLQSFDRFPPEWLDFLLLACHRVFPRISSKFLDSFTANFGVSPDERAAVLPYTMRYLDQAKQHPGLRSRELQEEEEREEQATELRKFLQGRTG